MNNLQDAERFLILENKVEQLILLLQEKGIIGTQSQPKQSVKSKQ